MNYLQIVDVLIEFMVVFPPFLIIWLLYARHLRQQNVSVPTAHTVLLLLFSAYIVSVLKFTGTVSTMDFLNGTVGITAESISLIPFKGVTVMGFVLNVLLFLPLGFLMPLFLEGYDRFPKMLAAGFFTSLAIEVLQLFNWRATDIDDLMANTLGVAIGWLLFRLIVRRQPQKLQLSGTHPFLKREGVIVIALVFVLVFLLKPLYAQLSIFLFDNFLMV